MYKKVQAYYEQEQERNKELDEKIQSFRRSLEEQFTSADSYQPKVK